MIGPEHVPSVRHELEQHCALRVHGVSFSPHTQRVNGGGWGGAGSPGFEIITSCFSTQNLFTSQQSAFVLQPFRTPVGVQALHVLRARDGESGVQTPRSPRAQQSPSLLHDCVELRQVLQILPPPVSGFEKHRNAGALSQQSEAVSQLSSRDWQVQSLS